jgi:hypothetical protein
MLDLGLKEPNEMSQLTTTDTPQTSPAQIKANRQNATRSTGPRTDSGKSRTRLNGLRHGLTTQTALMPYEDRESNEAFLAQQIQALQPQSDAERTVAASIADDRWRLTRARAIEENIALGNEEDPQTAAALNQALTFLTDAKQIALLYESHINRNIKNNLAELRDLQNKAKSARDHLEGSHDPGPTP